jgi:hypothetical protein
VTCPFSRGQLGQATGIGRAQCQGLQLARPQEREQFAPAGTDAHRGDAALLEVHARAGEVEDDLLERRVVPDDQDPRSVVMLGQQLAGGVDVEPLAERGARLGRHVEWLARQLGGAGRAQERARVAGRELEPEPGERLARGDRLALAPRGQLALEVGLRLVRDGLAVPEKPELLMRHVPQRNHPRTCERGPIR